MKRLTLALTLLLSFTASAGGSLTNCTTNGGTAMLLLDGNKTVAYGKSDSMRKCPVRKQGNQITSAVCDDPIGSTPFMKTFLTIIYEEKTGYTLDTAVMIYDQDSSAWFLIGASSKECK